ncbi:MAG: PaaI family thioesterase [Acidobacteriia bacterium]|nr:PaaI family thioesterase [Terriglobia bacterium]
MPFNRLLGIRVTRRHKDGVTIECPLRHDLTNLAGVLHGGVTATMADAAVGIAIHSRFLGTRSATTVEMKVNYFLPVSGKKIRARAHLLRVGSTLCVGRVDLFNDSKKLVGTALVTYMLLPPEEKKR